MIAGRKALAALLKEAADAHHIYEVGRGKEDPHWERWYADWLMQRIGVYENPGAAPPKLVTLQPYR